MNAAAEPHQSLRFCRQGLIYVHGPFKEHTLQKCQGNVREFHVDLRLQCSSEDKFHDISLLQRV